MQLLRLLEHSGCKILQRIAILVPLHMNVKLIMSLQHSIDCVLSLIDSRLVDTS